MPPLTMTDAQLEIANTAAATLPPDAREAFMPGLARFCANAVVSDAALVAAIARILNTVRQTQKE